jgi:ABC-type multidrug transport system ATPase subunit
MNITAEKVKLAFGDNTVLDIPKLSVNGPALVVLTGPNGAGKSTLLRLFAGLLRPDDGTVKVGETKAHRRKARLNCGYSPDHPVLFDDMTIGDNITYAHESSGATEPHPLAVHLIETFGFSDLLKRFPSQLSRGQRQAASLIVASSRPVEVILFDEPTLALDKDNRSKFAAVLSEHSGDQLFVAASHEASMVEQARKEITLKGGKVAS